MPEVLVVGAGLAGLTAAWRAASLGRSVRVVSKGWGSLYWSTGCVDVVGYHPPDAPEAAADPGWTVRRLLEENPRHPYGLAGPEGLAEAVDALRELAGRAGYPLRGSLDRNWLLPSPVGAFRPTCLAPETMVAGDLTRSDPVLVAGFRRLPDFYPSLVAANLDAQGVPAREVILDPAFLGDRRFTTPVLLARRLEDPACRQEVAEAIGPELGDARRVGFPAVLGLDRPLEVQEHLRRLLGREVFEIPTLPPSVPGIRLHRLLVEAVERAGGTVHEGMEALGADLEGDRVTAVWTEAAARRRRHPASSFVLATGGILGGGIVTDHEGRVREPVLDLPLAAPDGRGSWFSRRLLDPAGHPVYRAGVETDDSLRPLDREGRVVHPNLRAAGTILAHGDVLRERSLEGVALATGFRAGSLAAREADRAA